MPTLIGRNRALVTRALGAETRAVIARMTSKPSATRSALIDNLIKSLKVAGIWSLLDAFYVLAAADAQAAKLNWIASAYDLTAVASPTFTADRGYAGDGVSSYLDTNFNASTASSPKFAQNSATQFIWSRTNLANGANHSGDFGIDNARIGRNLSTSGMGMGRPQSSVTDNSLIPGSYPGLASWSRSGAAAWASYANGTSASSGTTASAALTNGTFRIGSWTAGAFGVNQIAIAGFGSNLTAGQHAALKTALQNYLTAIGAA